MNYIKIRSILLYLLLCGLMVTRGQNVTIRGITHSWYRGQAIELWQFTDLVTQNRVLETRDSIAADGTFELMTQAAVTRPVVLKVKNFTAELYIQPGSAYTITLPEPDLETYKNSEVDRPLNFGIIGYDSTELNALIFDYQRQYNQLMLAADSRFLNRHAIFRRADSLQKICDHRYRSVDNPYFRDYCLYKIAALNASVSRGEEYLIRKYVQGRPVQHDHQEYMRFMESCFKGYFKAISTRHKGQSLYNIINDHADYRKLQAFLSREEVMKNDTLRELVCLINLWEGYFTAEFDAGAVESLTSQLLLNTAIEEHKKIARSMLAHFGKLQVGSQAPDFVARTRTNTMGTLSMFKGKWIYLNFFSSKNTASVREMIKMVDLKRRYGHKVVFVSICLDDSLAEYKRFLAANPRFDWQIWHNNELSAPVTAKQKYNVAGTEAYFLISNLGDIVQNPAQSPSEGIEYKFNVIFKIRQRANPGGAK